VGFDSAPSRSSRGIRRCYHCGTTDNHIESSRGGGGVVNQLGVKETDAVQRREVAFFRIDKGISMTFTRIFDILNREKISDAFRTRIECAPPLAARSWTTAAPTPDVPPWHPEL